MDTSEIKRHIERLPQVTTANHWGYAFFFYADDQKTPFVSIAEADNEYDAVSDLNREGVFRLNIGVSADTFATIEKAQEAELDYTALNHFMPHPHYAAQKFICILNPEGSRAEHALDYIEEAYQIAKARYEKREAGKA